MFIVLVGWLVIISIGILVGLIFNKMITEEKILKYFNIALGIILTTITFYFVITLFLTVVGVVTVSSTSTASAAEYKDAFTVLVKVRFILSP